MKTSLRGLQEMPLADADTSGEGGRVLGIVFALVGAALFSMKAIFVKLAYIGVALEPITLLFLRFLFAMPFYVGILVWVSRKGERVDRRVTVQAFALGMLGYYLCAWADFAGLQYITAQLERLILFTYPAFVVVIGGLFFGHKVRASGLAAIALAYSGVGLVFARGDIASGENVMLGSALILMCAVLFASFQLLAKPRIDVMGGVRFTCIAMLGATIGVSAHYVVQTYALGAGDPIGSLSGYILWMGVMLGIVCTVVPSFFTNIALGRIGAQGVAVLAMIGPVVTITAAIVVLGEPFGWVDAFGSAITLAGIALYTLLDMRAKALQRKTMPTAETR